MFEQIAVGRGLAPAVKRGVEDVAPYNMFAHISSVGAGAYDSPFERKQNQSLLQRRRCHRQVTDEENVYANVNTSSTAIAVPLPLRGRLKTYVQT